MNKKYLLANIVLITLLMPINIITIYLINTYEFSFNEINIMLLIQLGTFGIYVFEIILILLTIIKHRLQGGVLALVMILSWVYGFIQIKYVLRYSEGELNIITILVSTFIYIGLNLIVMKKIFNHHKI